MHIKCSSGSGLNPVNKGSKMSDINRIDQYKKIEPIQIKIRQSTFQEIFSAY